MVTTIQVSDKLWERLNKLKVKRGKTFEDVIWELIKTGEKLK